MDDNTDKQKSGAGNVKDFFKGFALAAAVIFPIFAAVCYSTTVREPIAEAPVSDTVQGVAVAPQSVSFMWLGTDSGGELRSCAAVRLDPSKGKVCVCVIPESTVLLSGKAPLTAKDIFGTRGATGVVAAAEETLEIQIKHFLCADSESAALLTDDVGNIDIYLDADISIDDEHGRTVYKRSRGNIQVTGNDAAVIFGSDVLSERERAELGERLWLSALSRIVTDGVPTAAIYASRVNLLDTDINPAYASALSRACSYLGEQNCEVVAVRLDGAFYEGRFEISETAATLLWEFFPRAASEET